MDDILLRGSSSTLIHKLIDSLHGKFSLKKMGRPEYFLGIEIKHLASGCLLLIKTKYIRDLLLCVNMYNANGMSTPMLTSCTVSRHGASTFSEALHYRSIVGALQYVTLM